MRIGGLWDFAPGAIYRAIDPLAAMETRGHEIVVGHRNGRFDMEALSTCDVLHVYRYLDTTIREVVRRLSKHGVAFTWDNDDDYSVFPEDSPLFETFGREGMAEKYAGSIQTARMAQVVTLTSEPLADRYRQAGVRRIEVIPNAAIKGARGSEPHSGIIIGWIAGSEHRGDLHRLGVRDALQRILDAHPSVQVESIGVDLGLEGRYRHTASEPFVELPRRMSTFDIGIAPLADIPFNHARSDIKVKEYAASGVPWLASSLTPYLGLGHDQGGELVDDDGWFAALERLVTDEEHRRALSANGRAWARTQTIDATAASWERAFRTAIVAASGQTDRLAPEGPPPTNAGGLRVATRRNSGLIKSESGTTTLRVPRSG